MSIRVERRTRLRAGAAEVWTHASRMRGVNAELGPWIRMTHPAVADDSLAANFRPGEPLFDSWILLLGVVPLDRHHLRIERLLPDQGFDEDSDSWLQRRWRHHRRIEPDGAGCIVTDIVEFEPRVGLMRPLLAAIVGATFSHRHRRLRALFG